MEQSTKEPSLNRFLGLLSRADDTLDRTKFAIKKRFNLIDPIVIMPYRGFGNQTEIKLSGRILEDEGITEALNTDSKWRNMVSMFKRFNSDEIPFANVQATFQGQTQQVQADDEGYFHLTFKVDPAALNSSLLWHPVQLELLDQIVEGQDEVEAVGEVLIPDRKSEFGVISDIDDTVLISETTQLLKVIKLSVMENALTRMPFEGAAGFYRALAKGKYGNYHNPFFYVSSSPWNLYDVLKDFFKSNNIPKGPILLRDIGISPTKFIKEKHNVHKLEKIRSILDTYADLKFVLIGDSGQHDPEIYQQVVHEHPTRILVIYIRDVSQDPRDVQIATIPDHLTGHGVPMVRCSNTEEAAQHALKMGLIKASSLRDVHQEKEKDEAQEEV